MKLILSSAVLAILGHYHVDAAGTGTFYTYFEDGGLGPSKWAFLDMEGNQCGGTRGQSGYGQSPVTITEEVAGTCDTDMSAYNFMAGDCTWDQLDFSISNNGVKVGPKAGAECSFGQMNIPHTPNKFNALQYHIHTYSEHEIEGQGEFGFFPAELHVVHQEETEESFAVFGTMMDVGFEDHPVFEYFLQGWEAYAQKIEDSCPQARRGLRALAEEEFKPVQQKVQCPAIGSSTIFNGMTPAFPSGDAPNLYDLPTDKNFGTYTYKGGLTTPGCTEIVNWNLLDKAMSISASQMARLESLILCYVQQELDDQGNVIGCSHATVASESGSTSRPPQPLMGRKVTHRCPTGPAVEYVDFGELPPLVDTPFVKPAPRDEPSNTGGGKCDKLIYENCPNDPRYNSNISPNLKARAPIWNDVEGYWVGTMKAYDAQGNPLQEVFASSEFKSTFPYSQQETMIFMNRTVQETRMYEHDYQIFSPASATFCSLPVPDMASNVRGAGKCGSNGFAMVSELFGTAAFEKDGSANIIMSNGLYEGTGKAIPVGANSFYKSVQSSGIQKVETISFANYERTQMTGSGQYFIFSDKLPYAENPLAQSYSFVVNQVSEETFKTMLMSTYDEANVLQDERLPIIESGSCVNKDACPTSQMYDQNDPLIAETPYEPDLRIKAGFIAMFAIIGVIGIVGALFALHKVQVKHQADRYRGLFAKRIAQTIEFSGKHDKLTPQALEDEFRRMDTDNDGTLSKEEMRQFMGDKMSEKDFEAMFIAMDIDHNGSVEFAEFVSFLSHVFEEFDRLAK